MVHRSNEEGEARLIHYEGEKHVKEFQRLEALRDMTDGYDRRTGKKVYIKTEDQRKKINLLIQQQLAKLRLL